MDHWKFLFLGFHPHHYLLPFQTNNKQILLHITCFRTHLPLLFSSYPSFFNLNNNNNNNYIHNSLILVCAWHHSTVSTSYQTPFFSLLSSLHFPALSLFFCLFSLSLSNLTLVLIYCSHQLIMFRVPKISWFVIPKWQRGEISPYFRSLYSAKLDSWLLLTSNGEIKINGQWLVLESYTYLYFDHFLLTLWIWSEIFENRQTGFFFRDLFT